MLLPQALYTIVQQFCEGRQFFIFHEPWGIASVVHDAQVVVVRANKCLLHNCELSTIVGLDVVPLERKKSVTIWAHMLMSHAQGMAYFVHHNTWKAAARVLNVEWLGEPFLLKNRRLTQHGEAPTISSPNKDRWHRPALQRLDVAHRIPFSYVQPLELNADIHLIVPNCLTKEFRRDLWQVW